MNASFEDRCKALLLELDLIKENAELDITPLTGGVASDIARVQTNDRVFCVKFALAKLKVAAEWHAPVHRNAAEYAWLETAAKVCPESALELFGRSSEQHGFAMEFLVGDEIYLWKDVLLKKQTPNGEAESVGDLLGRIHSASTDATFDTKPFQNRDDFRALRIEPYLSFTANQHPALKGEFAVLSDMLYVSSQVLVHGDVSPKNIIMRATGPVILDAECATMGDASFDPAFCLNHLILKAVHVPETRPELLDSVNAFWASYCPHITWEAPADLEARICKLLPALMVARVDGKSPVEYLTSNGKEVVREMGIKLMHLPEMTIAKTIQTIEEHLKDIN